SNSSATYAYETNNLRAFVRADHWYMSSGCGPGPRGDSEGIYGAAHRGTTRKGDFPRRYRRTDGLDLRPQGEKGHSLQATEPKTARGCPQSFAGLAQSAGLYKGYRNHGARKHSARIGRTGAKRYIS